MMRRREFIAGLGGAAAWPVAARAQQRAAPVVGFLNNQSADDSKSVVAAFLQGLKETGFVDGQNVTVEYRFADNQAERLPALAADLVRSRVTVIAVAGQTAALAAKAATATTPIVFATYVDPVALGLVATLNRPGANVTGYTPLSTELVPKLLQLLRELIPTAALVGVLTNSADRANQEPIIAELQAAARALGLRILFQSAEDDGQIETAFAEFSRQHVSGVLIGSDSFYNRRMEKLAALGAQSRLPSIYGDREFAFAGGLMSYGNSNGYAFRQLGIYAGRILKGENPAELPVEQGTRIELTLNLKTAKALGIEFPTALLVRADEVIE
jgi:putative tryptophan/tyrosine transport system substrate-binding protein